MPMNRATLELFAPLDRSAPEPLRAQLEDAICAAITGGGAPAGHPPARLARARRGARTSRAASSARPTPRSPPRAGSRSAAARPGRPRRPPPPASAPVRRPATARDRDRVEARRDPLARSRAARPDARPRPISPRSRGGRGRRRCGRCSPRCPTRRSTTATRAATTSCAPSWPPISCGCAASSPRRRPRGHERLHAGAVADVPGAEGARARRGRGRGPVARRLVGDDPLGRAGGRRACRSTSTASGVDALDADAVLVTPAHQFPTGAVLAPERRRALLAWGGIVIEDDYDSEYRYDRAPVGTLQRLAPDRVVYLGTASKTLAPGAAARLARRAAGRSPAAIARERWAVDSGGAGDRRPRLRPPARHRRGRPPPAPHPPRVPRAPRPRWSRRSSSGCPECRVDGRRRRPAPAAAAPARDGRGGGGGAPRGAPDPDPRPRRLPAHAARRRARARDRLRPAPAAPRSTRAGRGTPRCARG